MNSFQHFGYQFHLGVRSDREYIAVKMDGAALIFGFREDFAYSFQHLHTFVAHNEFHTIQATAAKPLEEAYPAGLVLFHALGSA